MKHEAWDLVVSRQEIQDFLGHECHSVLDLNARDIVQQLRETLGAARRVADDPEVPSSPHHSKHSGTHLVIPARESL
ncbi:hypothetical protein [Saccharopolyspora pogona]|uniref:hypothetical protein n=1 Tax=Saccharopolyspora pogona TaxID=333966 RepID=UPI00168251A3|nr:hypothetical protein [Saccharopolyspora pogona]